MPEPRVKRLDDPRTMRALAHPLRLRLLGLLRTAGPATASSLAERAGRSVALVSYHLRQLDRFGFIEAAPELGHDGRERWWRPAHERTSWSTADFLDTPERMAAAGALQAEVLRRYVETIEQFFEEEWTWPREWIEAATMSDLLLDLTVEEARALQTEMWEVVERYSALPERPDTEKYFVIVHGFPRRLDR